MIGDYYGDGTRYRGVESAPSTIKTYTIHDLVWANGVNEPLRQELEQGAWDPPRGRNAAVVIRERLGEKV